MFVAGGASLVLLVAALRLALLLMVVSAVAALGKARILVLVLVGFAAVRLPVEFPQSPSCY